MADKLPVRVEGLNEFRRALKAAGGGLEKGLQKLNKAESEKVAAEARRDYAARFRVRTGRHQRAIRARATQTKAFVILAESEGSGAGGLLGQEWGSWRFPQFPEPTTVGYYLWHNVRDARERLQIEYLRLVEDLTKEAFPRG